MSVKDYLSEVIAPALVKELELILTVKGVTRNKDLLGDYAEAALRSALEEFVKTGPALIATGEADHQPRVMGVICVIEEKPSSRLETLFNNGNAVALFDNSSSEAVLRPKDILPSHKFPAPCCPLLSWAGDIEPANGIED